MSLDTLSEAAGLSRNYLGDVEMGTRRPRGLSLDAAFRIARGLGAELPELLGFHELTGAGVEAGRLVSALPPGLRGAVLNLLRGIMATHPRIRHSPPRTFIAAVLGSP